MSAEPLHVLQTPVRYPPYIGGVESHVRSLSRNLVDLGHEVTVLCADEGGERHDATGNDIQVRRLQSVGKVAKTNITPSLPVRLVAAARRADVIHTHLPTPWSADLSALAGAVTSTPVVLTYHNDIVGDGVAQYVANAYNATALRATLRASDRVVTTQHEYVERSDALDPVRRKVEVIRNGVDTDAFHPVDVGPERRRELGVHPDRPTLFFLSVLDEFHRYKGLDVLLRALADLDADDGRTPHLLAGGDGDLLDEYRALAADLGVTDHVTFLGRVPDADLRDLYSAADLFVLPSTCSDQEGFGLVVLEALACQTPVVTTDVVGVAAEIDARGLGTIVDTGDPAALARGVRRSLPADQFDVEQGRRLCEEEYSWRRVASETAALYAELCA